VYFHDDQGQLQSLPTAWTDAFPPDPVVVRTQRRSPDCDVVVDRPEVSRRHAEILLTPANQWVIRDLGSSNGTLVNGKRIESCPITIADVVEIGPVSLSLGESPERQAAAIFPPQRPQIIVEDSGTEVFYDRPRIEECTTQPYPRRLEETRRRLSELTDPAAVYAEICQALAQGTGTAAVIFRIPKDRPVSNTTEVVAYHFGSNPEGIPAHMGNRIDPFHRSFRVSHRLIEAVRAGGRPLMTKSIFSCDTQITISLIDEHSPRALMCTPIDSRTGTVDLLYIDVPINDRMMHGPEEMFAFLQAVAQQATTFMTSASE
jgi:hypothetical protein